LRQPEPRTVFWLSADAYYNVGGKTSIDGTPQDNAASTLRVRSAMGFRLWRGADLGLNYERIAAKLPATRILRPSASNFDNSGEADVPMIC
jgi:hypothetical protein